MIGMLINGIAKSCFGWRRPLSSGIESGVFSFLKYCLHQCVIWQRTLEPVRY